MDIGAEQDYKKNQQLTRRLKFKEHNDILSYFLFWWNFSFTLAKNRGDASYDFYFELHMMPTVH